LVKSPPVLLNKRLGEPQSLPGRDREEKSLFALLGRRLKNVADII
jgi:hypothetical protein